MENYRMKSSPPILTFHMLSSYSLPGSYCEVSKCGLTEFCLCIYLLHIQIFIIFIIKLALYYTQYSIFFLKLSNVALRSFHNCIEYFSFFFIATQYFTVLLCHVNDSAGPVLADVCIVSNISLLQCVMTYLIFISVSHLSNSICRVNPNEILIF